MHDASMRWIAQALDTLRWRPAGSRVVELGSLDVNGSARPLFAGAASYIGVDRRAGRGVDVVADAADWGEDGCCDLVLCAETLEHTDDPRAVVLNAARLLADNGALIVTAAAPERAPHGVDGGAVTDEPYQGINPAMLRRWLEIAGLTDRTVTHAPDIGDVYALARRQRRRRSA